MPRASGIERIARGSIWMMLGKFEFLPLTLAV